MPGTGLSLAIQESGGRVSGWVWNRAEPFLRCKPRRLVGYPVRLLTLGGANYKGFIWCDHKNLEYLQSFKVRARIQARWSEILSAYDVVIDYPDRSRYPADGLLGSPNYEIGYERHVAQLLATGSVEPYNDLTPAIIAAQASDPLAVDVFITLIDRPMNDGTDPGTVESQWTVVLGVVTHQRRIYIPAVDSLSRKVMTLFHDNTESCHFGALKTTEQVPRDFNWPATNSHGRRYENRCKVSHRIRAPRHSIQRINMLSETASWPWEGVTMYLVTDLPESQASGYTVILVIMDRLTEMAL